MTNLFDGQLILETERLQAVHADAANVQNSLVNEHLLIIDHDVQ